MSDIFEHKLPRKEGSRQYINREYGNKISLNLLNLRRDGRFCDIDLISGDSIIKAHRVVLASSCPYFDAMFSVGLEESQKKIVELPSVPPDLLPMIIDFIYTGKIEIDKSTVQRLLIAADMLQLRELVTGCGEFLRRELHPSNALGIFRFADAHNCNELAEEALEHAQANWSIVAKGDELLELPLSQLITLLSSEQLRVDSEAQVLYPALRWLEHDPACRRRHCFEVLRYVRLPLISTDILDKAIKEVQDPSIAVALKTVRVDMKTGRGALVSLGAEPRARARRMLVVVGGFCHDSTSLPPLVTDNILSTALKFDLHKRVWENLSPMNIARIQPGVAAMGGRVYAVGGEQGSQILANGEVYDIQTDKWSDIAPMKEARCEFGLTGWRGRLYAFGGWVGSDMGSSVEVYDPALDEWTHAGHMPEPRFGMGVVTYEGHMGRGVQPEGGPGGLRGGRGRRMAGGGGRRQRAAHANARLLPCAHRAAQCGAAAAGRRAVAARPAHALLARRGRRRHALTRAPSTALLSVELLRPASALWQPGPPMSNSRAEAEEKARETMSI